MINSNKLRISLDRKEPNSDVDFISHAHTDHLGAAKSSKMVLASSQTIQLIQSAQNITIQNKLENPNLKLIEAGHMLGSRQLCVNDDVSGNRILYTGDFQTVKSKTSKPIDVVDTDILIMDSTYDSPFYKFDDKYEVETSIQQWTSKMLKSGTVIFGAYAMGKSQELIALLNEVGIKPIVSKKISKVCKVYVENGVNLDYTSSYEDGVDAKSLFRDNFVGVTDTRNLDWLKHGLEMVHSKSIYTAVATGFAKIFKFRTDAQFSLSDHADFYQSMQYIEDTSARSVLTYGTNAVSFANNLKNKGYVSIPFKISKISGCMQSISK